MVSGDDISVCSVVVVSECDSCAQTLLNDLEKLDIDLRRMKEQLDLGSLEPLAQEYLQKLKDALAVTTVFLIPLLSVS